MSAWRCEHCGGNEFGQLPRTFVLTEKDSDKKEAFGSFGDFDVMVQVCTKCGHIRLFSQKIIDKSKE